MSEATHPKVGTWIKGESGDECYSCHFSADRYRVVSVPLARRDPKVYADTDEPEYLCEVCWDTFCNYGWEYPGNDCSGEIILMAIAGCANLILREIRRHAQEGQIR